MMPESQYSLAEVAKITGKSEKTISRWIKSGKLPAVRQGTGYLIDAEDIPLKVASDIDRHTYIQQRLLHYQDEPEVTGKKSEKRPVDMQEILGMANLIANGQNERHHVADNLSSMLEKHQSEVQKIIKEQNELAEKYARATYQIGQLEERNRFLEESNVRLEQKITLLPPPEQWKSTREELKEVRENMREAEQGFQQRLLETERKLQEVMFQKELLQREKEELAEQKEVLKEEHEQAQSALQEEKQKGFWQRLFGA